MGCATFRLGDLARDGGRTTRRGRRKADAQTPLAFYGKHLATYMEPGSYAPAPACPNGSQLEPEPGRVGMVTAPSLMHGVFYRILAATFAPARDLPPSSVTLEGDIVVNLSSPFQAAVIDAKGAGYFVSNAFAVIRLDGALADGLPDYMAEVDPWFLAGFLNTDRAGEAMRAAAASGDQMSVSDLLDLRIPALPVEVQRELGRGVKSRADAARRRYLEELAGRCATDAMYEAATS